ncbi:unnamed protein product [Lactuca virosa]|uniref:non-specific serine/threonine protein kinase n=1 Tax=Lactuca virosa TaxID=75947 RepID=A0AAU9MC02_9ASTR|nr:unnamed protein product [Lactuca virosa]
MDNFKLCFLFSLFIVTHLVSVTIAETDFWYQYCYGTYTASGSFQRNVDDVLYSITKTNNGYGFFNQTAGEGLDKVNAVALCRADIDQSDCERCVDDATRKLQENCIYQKEAMGCYDYCQLVYSNSSLLYTTVMDKDDTKCFNNPNFTSNWTILKPSMVNLFYQLRTEASKGGILRKYAARSMSVIPDSSTISGLVQCTPDLSESQCNQCLVDAINLLQVCSFGRIGSRVYKRGCNARYELYRFFNETWFPTHPPSLQSPQSETKGTYIKGQFIGILFTAGALIAISGFFIWHRHHFKLKHKDYKDHESDVTSSIYVDKSKFDGDNDDTFEMHHFHLSTIQDATNGFSLENKLGEGGFGPVYLGKLDDGREIAVKRLSKNSSQGLEEFKTEVRLIIKLQHKNLVKLLGCCIKGDERLLVYEYMVNTSLDSFLFDPAKAKELNWIKREKIICGVAKGLRYLHEDSRLKIIHRDLKTSNILLDDAMDPKISDFGTARIFGTNQIEAKTNIVVGTYGYMAPEYAMEGLFSTKSDVYSFGVLLLEIIHGRRNNGFYFQEHDETLLSYAWRTWKEGRGEDLIDKILIKNCPLNKTLRWIHIALLCVQEDPKDRPNMSSVVFMLEGQGSTLPEPSEPPLSFTKIVTFDEVPATDFRTLTISSSSQPLEA